LAVVHRSGLFGLLEIEIGGRKAGPQKSPADC